MLENIYGTLFYPSQTFEKLRQNPALFTALAIVALISALDPLISADTVAVGLAFALVWAVFTGVLKWSFLALFLEVLASIFKKGGKIEIFLTLSAFALLPWLFMGPIMLFKAGGAFTAVIGILSGVAIWIWTTILTLFAVSKAYELSSERVLLLLFIPFLGSVIVFDWAIGFFSTLTGILAI